METAQEIKLQVGVKIFLKNEKGKFLLVKRNPIKYANVTGDWDIVGGRIKPRTSLIENLKREVWEETQLQIIGVPKLIHAQDIIRDDKHVVRLTYIGTTEGDPILDTVENTDFEWKSIEEMKDVKNIDEFVREILNQNIINEENC